MVQWLLRSLFILILGYCSFFGLCHANNAPIVDSQIVVQKSAPTFTILLKSNPTTGFTWILKDYDSKLIQPIGKAYIPSPKSKKLIGGGGYQKFVFTVHPKAFDTPQTTFITLIYARPWNMNSVGINKYKVIINHDN
jgi:inhibitor of cysteine peptidase